MIRVLTSRSRRLLFNLETRGLVGIHPLSLLHREMRVRLTHMYRKKTNSYIGNFITVVFTYCPFITWLVVFRVTLEKGREDRHPSQFIVLCTCCKSVHWSYLNHELMTTIINTNVTTEINVITSKTVSHSF